MPALPTFASIYLPYQRLYLPLYLPCIRHITATGAAHDIHFTHAFHVPPYPAVYLTTPHVHMYRGCTAHLPEFKASLSILPHCCTGYFCCLGLKVVFHKFCTHTQLFCLNLTFCYLGGYVVRGGRMTGAVVTGVTVVAWQWEEEGGVWINMSVHALWHVFQRVGPYALVWCRQSGCACPEHQFSLRDNTILRAHASDGKERREKTYAATVRAPPRTRLQRTWRGLA